MDIIKGILSVRPVMSGKLTVPTVVVPNPYEGSYDITPLAHETVILNTRNKTLSDDVTVLKVPYYETSNIFDGETVYIADENELIIGG